MLERRELKSAYGGAPKPARPNAGGGRSTPTTLGENLLFALDGRQNPSKRVTAVALYDGDGPQDDGRGVDVEEWGTLPFAGYIPQRERVA